MPKHSEKDEAVLSAIPVVSTDRSEHDSSRKSRRGLNRSVLEAGQSASDAINAARAQTERYKFELAEQRVRCGQATDALRDLQDHARVQGAASPFPFTFSMPPDPLTAEIFKRDAAIATWSGAYRTVAEAAARDREDFTRERAHLLATIADRDQALTAATLRSDNERAAAKSGIADALVTVPPDIAAELDALRLADTTYASRLASAQDSLGAAERTVAALQKDIHYYVHQSHKATQRELLARRAELEQQEQNFRLRAQLAQSQLAAPGFAQPLSPALPHPPADGLAVNVGDSIGTAELEEQLSTASPDASVWSGDWNQRTPQSASRHTSRASSISSLTSRLRRSHSSSPFPSSVSR
jgi:hypothetical protein